MNRNRPCTRDSSCRAQVGQAFLPDGSHDEPRRSGKRGGREGPTCADARTALPVPLATLAVCLALAIGSGCTTAPQPATEAAAPALPEDVLVPLHAMGDLLRSANTMKFTSLGLMDEALANGQLVQIGRRSAYTVRRPDGLYVGIDGDDAKWQLWYDGKQLTVLDRVTDDFAVSTAPPTLDQLFDNAFREHGLSIPMSDLMYSDADGGLLKNVQAARHLGIDYLGDYACHHLGFRQETIDWQLWIDAGDQAVPRKLVIAYKHEPGTPQYVATLEDWELDGDLPDTEFMARVPQDKRAMTIEAFLGYGEEEPSDDND